MSDLAKSFGNASEPLESCLKRKLFNEDFLENSKISSHCMQLKKNTGCIAKTKNLLHIINNNGKKAFGLSPISEIATCMIDTQIGTPLTGKGKRKFLKCNRSKSAVSHLKNVEEFNASHLSSLSTSAEISPALTDLSTNESLISNNFTLNGNDETSGNNDNNNNSNNNFNYYSRNIIKAQRRQLSFSPLQSSYDNDDFASLYDEQTTIMSPTRFRRQQLQFSPSSSSVDHDSHDEEKQNDHDDRLPLQHQNILILDELDSSSVDSGFGQSTKFKFAAPKLPMKQLQQQQMEPSPRKFKNNNNSLLNNFNYNLKSKNVVQTSPKQFKIFHSLSSGSMESIDDEWSDLIEMEMLDEDQSFPSNLTSLISGDIKSIRTTPDMKHNDSNNNNSSSNNNNHSSIGQNRPAVRRCLSLNESNGKQTARKGLFNNDSNNNSTDYYNSPLSQYNNRVNTSIPKTPEILKTVQEQQFTPNSLVAQQFAQQQMQAERCFKRPEPPSFSPIQSKRYKTELKMHVAIQQQQQQQYCLQQSKSTSIIEDKENSMMMICSQVDTTVHHQSQERPQRPAFRKSMSMNDADIMTALSRSSTEPELIGDFSKPFCLPLMDGKHRDLKSISCSTLAKLLNGEFDGSVASYKIIDCRYPYEFEGGHIQGALNLYTQEQILEELVNSKTETPTVHPNGPKRNILVFHCEFSSERGPKLSRFLRNHDRWRNSNSYPALHYPEIYLLHGGYKEFYEHHSSLCNPIAYRPMLEPSFGEQYRQCRAKSKSWNGDIKGSCSKYGLKKSRSRLLL